MSDPLVEYLCGCCVQVMGARPGCGFFIAPNLVVTCAHVLGREVKKGDTVELRQWQDQERRLLGPATVIGIAPDDDLALLQTVAANVAYAPLSGEATVGHPLVALGFPQRENREEFDQFSAQYEGRTQFLDASGRAGAESKFTMGQVEPGFSGGPLLNLRTCRVMGVVVATRDRRSALGGWAIELPVLTKFLEDRGIILPSIDPQWTDVEAKQRESRTPDVVRAVNDLKELVQAASPAQARVEELSRILGTNQTAIRLALRSLGEQEEAIPDERLPIKLIESIQGFERQLEQLAVLQSDAPEVEARFKAARSALEAEDREAADASLEEAAVFALSRAREAEALEMRAREVHERGQLEAAEAYAQRGQLAMASIRYAVAAQHFKQAAEIVPLSKVTERAEYLGRYAAALYRQGEEKGDNTALAQAIEVYHRLLKEYTRERVPLDWAATQNNLGNTLVRLGERESGTARLEEAVAAYREALKEYTRERVPLNWAATQTNLGLALMRLGERHGTARLEEAVAAYREALKEYTRERVPLDWAMTQNNLGLALMRLGERESGTARLEEAVAAYREALKERTRERVPLDWAMTQNNLGLALMRLGERESGTARLEEAVAAYREALKERTRERVPLDWAMTQNNLGLVLSSLGEREHDIERLRQAEAAIQSAYAVFKEAGYDHYEDYFKERLHSLQQRLEAY